MMPVKVCRLIDKLSDMRTSSEREHPDGPVNAADWKSVSSVLSHWKLAATSIEIRLSIKQLQEGMSRESTRQLACNSLDKLTSAVFYSCKKPEEADFIADLITDVDRSVAGKVSASL